MNNFEARTVFQRVIKECSTHKLFKEKQHLYSFPLGFTSWREILGHLVSLDILFHGAMTAGNECDQESSITASYALRNDSPVRNISRNLGEAFLKTSTRGIIKPPIALEHFIINLPKGLLFDESDQPFNALLVMTGECFRKACFSRKVKLTMGDFDGLFIQQNGATWITKKKIQIAALVLIRSKNLKLMLLHQICEKLLFIHY